MTKLTRQQCIAKSFQRASDTYDKAAILHQTVSEELLDRLDFMATPPERILDLGCNTGRVTEQLQARYPNAERCIGVDLSEHMLHQSTQPFDKICGAAESLPIAADSIDLVFSSLVLQWCADLPRVFSEVRRVLRKGGIFVFATYGPDTFKELRKSWASVDEFPHVENFTDMHDIGDGLVKAGLSEPVLDVVPLTVTYPNINSLLQDLRAQGVRNVHPERLASLTGKKRFQRFTEAYEQFRNEDGHLPLTYEVVYGLAWAGERTYGVETGGEVRIPLTALIRRRKG